MQSVLKEILTGIRLSFSLYTASMRCQMPFLLSDLLPRCDAIRSHKKAQGIEERRKIQSLAKQSWTKALGKKEVTEKWGSSAGERRTESRTEEEKIDYSNRGQAKESEGLVEDRGRETHLGRSWEWSRRPWHRNGTGPRWWEQKQKKNGPSGDWAPAKYVLKPWRRWRLWIMGRERTEKPEFRRVIYLRERATPRAEPSADRWDWPTYTRGQRSMRRGLGNLTGRDRSLSGRPHLRESTETLSHPEKPPEPKF